MPSLCVMSWNVNSIRPRLGHVLQILSAGEVDILLLQETKASDAEFPRLEIEAAGFTPYFHGQKSYNGVAILSRLPLRISQTGLPDFEDPQARYIEAVLDEAYGNFTLASLYVPNGNPMGEDGGESEKFKYKCNWLSRFAAHAREKLAGEGAVCFAGDYNIIPQARDVWDAARWAQDALMAPFCRDIFGSLLEAGFSDALRLCQPEAELYSFWDYQGGALRKNHGIRIDHLLLSPLATGFLRESGVLAAVRQFERPSDHVPVWAKFELS